MGWTVDKLWSESQQGPEIYLVSETSSPVLDPTYGPIPRVPEVSTQEVKRSGRETDIASPSSAKSNNEWSYSSPPPCLHDVHKETFSPNFMFC